MQVNNCMQNNSFGKYLSFREMQTTSLKIGRDLVLKTVKADNPFSKQLIEQCIQQNCPKGIKPPKIITSKEEISSAISKNSPIGKIIDVDTLSFEQAGGIYIPGTGTIFLATDKLKKNDIPEILAHECQHYFEKEHSLFAKITLPISKFMSSLFSKTMSKSGNNPPKINNFIDDVNQFYLDFYQKTIRENNQFGEQALSSEGNIHELLWDKIKNKNMREQMYFLFTIKNIVNNEISAYKIGARIADYMAKISGEENNSTQRLFLKKQEELLDTVDNILQRDIKNNFQPNE